jgi:phosphoenolpyruvate carboxylase
VRVFGFHLAPIDLRQNSDVHERVVAELLETRRSPAPTTSRWMKRRASRCCSSELATARPLHRRGVQLLGRSDVRAGDLPRGAAAHLRFGPDCVPNCIISKTDSVSDCSNSRCC